MNAQPPLSPSATGQAHRPLAVLVVDDSDVARESLANYVAAQPGLRVVAIASTSLDALKQLSRFTVDLVLTDLNMPGMDGVSLARRIRALPQPSRVIVTSVQDTPSCREAAVAAGADDFIPKSELGVRLMPAVARLFPPA